MINTSGIYEALDANLTKVGMQQLTIVSKQISALHKVFTDNKSFYAPLTSLIQSSGSGKTRICLELLKTHPGLYMVFRKPTDSGIPAQHPWMESFIKFVFDGAYNLPKRDDTRFENSFSTLYSPCRFLLALSHVCDAYMAWYGRLREENDGKMKHADVLKYMTSQFYKNPNEEVPFPKSDSSLMEDFLDFDTLKNSQLTVFETVKKVTENFLKISKLKDEVTVNANSKDEVTTIEEGVSNLHLNSFPFLLILDEADRLNDETKTGFNIIRRGLHLLSTDVQLMVIALGTNSDILEFFPAIQDNSLRDVKRPNLLMPLFLPGNFDIFADDFPVHTLALDRKMLLSEAHFKLLTTFGRPLWSSCDQVKVIEIAMGKLLNGHSNSVASSFAILSSRASVSVNPNHILARTLIRSYMIIASYISTDARDLIVSYSSEPILAIAARKLINQDDRLENAFATLRTLSDRQAIDIGRNVEYIFEIFTLIAVDKAGAFGYLKSNSKMEVHRILNLTNEIPDKVPKDLLPLLTFERFGLGAMNDKPFAEAAETTETVETTETTETVETSSIINNGPSGYKVITVDQFVHSAFGLKAFKAVSNLLPSNIRDGLVNISHFVNLERFWNPNLTHHDINLTKRDKDNVIDKSLLKCGLLRQCGFVMPPGYFGIDFIIPFAFESKNSGTSYSFIAVQSKTSPETVHTCLLKMDMTKHLIQCPKCLYLKTCECDSSPSSYSTEEYNEVCSHQLTFLLSFNLARDDMFKDLVGADIEAEEREYSNDSENENENDDVNETSAVDYFCLKDEALPSKKTTNYKEAMKAKKDEMFAVAKDKFQNDFKTRGFTLDGSNVIPKSFPSFGKVKSSIVRPDLIISQNFTPSKASKASSDQASDQASDSTNVRFTIETMKWTEDSREILCIAPYSAKIFQKLVGTKAFREAAALVLCGKSPLNKVDKLHLNLVQYSLHRGRFSNFYATNPLLRKLRSLPSIIETPEEEYFDNIPNELIKSMETCMKRDVYNDASKLTLENKKRPVTNAANSDFKKNKTE